MSSPTPLNVVAISGSLRAPSTTSALLQRILDTVAAARPTESRVVELAPLAVDLATAVTDGDRSPAVTEALDAVAAADLLVVGTPVYRGSYTGLFKLFVDLVDQSALAGTPVLLAAGGGNDQHSLVIEHELRPLFGFFQALTAPIGVYAKPGDYTDGVVTGEQLRATIDRAVAATLPLLRG
jgi:FMN reductase